MEIPKELKDRAFTALVAKEGGAYKEKTARNIRNGTQKMVHLDKAIAMSKEPFFLDISIWDKLYKGE